MAGAGGRGEGADPLLGEAAQRGTLRLVHEGQRPGEGATKVGVMGRCARQDPAPLDARALRRPERTGEAVARTSRRWHPARDPPGAEDPAGTRPSCPPLLLPCHRGRPGSAIGRGQGAPSALSRGKRPAGHVNWSRCYVLIFCGAPFTPDNCNQHKLQKGCSGYLTPVARTPRQPTARAPGSGSEGAHPALRAEEEAGQRRRAAPSRAVPRRDRGG